VEQRPIVVSEQSRASTRGDASRPVGRGIGRRAVLPMG